MFCLKYPKGEIAWVDYYDGDGSLRYVVTSRPTRETYFLYEVADDKLVKLGKDPNPARLEEKYVRL